MEREDGSGIVSVKGVTPIFIYVHLLLYHELERVDSKMGITFQFSSSALLG